jgi:chemotaxis protein MotB
MMISFNQKNLALMKKIKFLAPVAIVMIYVSSCVPARQFEELKDKEKKCAQELADIKANSLSTGTKLTECENDVQLLKRRVTNLQNDTMVMGNSLRLLTKNYDKLNQTYELLLAKNKELLEGNANENKLLVTNYQLTQEQLQREQDALKIAKQELENRKTNLDKLNEDLKTSQEALKAREAKLTELQTILARKDSTVKALKTKVTDALLGFQNNGLTVEQKNGKVYVSLEEKLLFASGSISVDAKGAEAIKSLAKVLEQNPDINILVEGHTDNVPYSSGSGGIKDNWDLSVLRATSIVKLITVHSTVDAKRLTAAGHGEFFPIDAENTAQARKKNRRTEIILTPKLDELLKVLETN